MKAEQIHIALKQNQQIFKLALVDDLIDAKNSADKAFSKLYTAETLLRKDKYYLCMCT